MNAPKSYCDPDSDSDQDSDDDPHWYMDGDPDSELPPRPGRSFMAWCPEPGRLDAFLAFLSAVAGESRLVEVDDENNPTKQLYLPFVDAATQLRREYARDRSALASSTFKAPSDRLLKVGAGVHAERVHWYSPIAVGAGWMRHYLFHSPIPRSKHGGPCSVEVEAGVACKMDMADAYKILVQLCSSSTAVTTGGCGEGDWGFPTTNAASYHPDGYAARDLAMSWLHHNDNYSTTLTAGFSIEALREGVDASPRGISVSPVEGEWLSREEVLAAMDLPPEVLFAALDVSAAKVPPKWKAIEADVRRVLRELEDADADDVEWIPITDEHIRFFKEHTPAIAKRLDNGAVVLFAHPFRTLWPLWADALALLGIRPKGSG
jgi:hypothetical protein